MHLTRPSREARYLAAPDRHSDPGLLRIREAIRLRPQSFRREDAWYPAAAATRASAGNAMERRTSFAGPVPVVAPIALGCRGPDPDEAACHDHFHPPAAVTTEATRGRMR